MFRIFYQDTDYDIYSLDAIDYATLEEAIAAIEEITDQNVFYAIYKYGISSDADVMVRIREDCPKMEIYHLHKVMAGKDVGRMTYSFMRYAIRMDDRKFVYSSLPWGLCSSD